MSAVTQLPRVPEHEEQANFFTEVLFRFQHRDDFIDQLLFSVPNGMWLGGGNKAALMQKYKDEGLRPGVSDILYLQPRGDYAYLAIEMKAMTNSIVSDTQTEFLAAVNGAGGLGEVCYGAEAAVAIFAMYMSFNLKET